MPNRKKYSNLSKRQVFRRLAAQSKADIHVLQNSSLQLAKELQSEDDIFYIRQRLCEEKNNFQPKINIESGGIHDIVENKIDIENIEMNDEDNIIHQGMILHDRYDTDSEEEFEEDNSDENNVFNFIEELQSFAVNSQIKHVHLNRLLKLLKKAGFNNLPEDSRSLLRTPRTSNLRISPCPPGEYLHYGLKTAIENQLCDSTYINEMELMFDINIDGLPIAKSSATCLWPILGKFVHGSFNTPFVIGIYHGNKKPSSVHNYLTPFINEYKQLQNEGIVIDGKRFFVTLRCIICDSPARSYVKCTKQFNGYFSCDKCTEEGEFRDRMVFLSESAPLRTDDTFRSRMNEEHHIAVSPFESLPIDMVKQFPLDFLHVVLLGVMKSLLMSWLDNRRHPKFSSQAVQKLSDSIVVVAQWVPKDFNRKPRGLQELCRWKGTEFRFFLLYLGPIILQHFLSEEYLIHFNSLNCAIRILCDPRDCYRNNAYAKELLIYFVQEFKKLYGEQYVTSNFHYLIHLNEDVKMYGPLDSYSSFDFENHMQILKRMLRKHANPLQQIHRRLSEKHNRDQHLQKKKNPKILNPLLKYPIVSELPLGCHSEHKILQFRTFELSNKRPDNCCFMTDATIVIIKHIGLIENVIVVLGRQFLQKNDISNYPCSSSNMNIYKVENLSPVHMWPAQCISHKGFLMQYYVVFFDDFCNLVPANWINVESNDILWPPKNLKFNKHKMHYLQPDNDWLTYKCRKRLGPFESLQIANQIEEHCINASTNEDTDDMCEKALFLSQTEKKRRRKKPAYLDDTSEEEQAECKDKCATTSFRLPPSHYQQQNSDEHEISSINIPSLHSPVDRNETSNMSECGSSCISTEEFENNKALEKSFVQDKNFDSTFVYENTEGTIATLQKQTSTHLGKKACIEKIRDVNRTTENLSRSSKQRRIECKTSANADLETNANPVLVRNAEDRPAQNHQVQERNRTRFSEPMTEERFLTYYKSLNTKLNHIINLLKDRHTDMQVDEEDSLLPNFPLRTIQEFEQFQENLVTSLELQKLYIREIKMIGGSDPGKFTRAALRYFISNEVALKYSWSGQKNTRKFRETLISQLIVETISKIKNVPKNDIETIIKKWLQHASDRLKK